MLIADSFKHLMLESKEHVVVLVFSPRCEACQEVKPHWVVIRVALLGSWRHPAASPLNIGKL